MGAARGSGRCYGKFGVCNSTGALENLVLGKNYAYEARVLLRFQLADSAPRIDSVDSVRLVLHTRVWQPVPFGIYAVNTDWVETEATWHHAEAGIPWLKDGGDFDPGRLIRFDTLRQDSTVVFMPRSCLDTLVHGTYGLILVPEVSEPARFAILYSDNVTTKKPTLTYLYGSRRRSFDCIGSTYICDTLGLSLGRDQLWIGSGYIFRTYLKFDFEALRPESASTVIVASLTIFPESVFAQRETVDIAVRRLLEDYDPPEAQARYDATAIGRTSLVVRRDSMVNLDIRPLVQFWVENPDSNHGMILSVEPENYDITRIELRRGDRMPALRVGYVKPPSGRFGRL
ncbi:MAG: DNRLRE domain-containing protein [candidate division WOR-3 bacterium]